MMVGSLNLLSIAFAVLFVGLGVDFGIQFSVRYRSERFKRRRSGGRHWPRPPNIVAIPLLACGDGDGSTVPCRSCPPTTRASRNLAKIAGVGMMVAFLASITVLPALLTLLNPPGEKEPVGYAFLAPVDHFLEKHRVAIIVGTLVARRSPVFRCSISCISTSTRSICAIRRSSRSPPFLTCERIPTPAPTLST